MNPPGMEGFTAKFKRSTAQLEKERENEEIVNKGAVVIRFLCFA
jgi:hypothetical protein